MKQALLKKLRSQSGDSIGEVLVSLLIASLALVMLASLIATSTSLIQRSREKMEDYYTENNRLDAQTDTDLGTVILGNQDNTIKEEISVYYHVNDSFNTEVFSYWEQPASGETPPEGTP